MLRKILSFGSSRLDDERVEADYSNWKPSYWRPDLPTTTYLNHQNNYQRYPNANRHQLHINNNNNEIRNTALQKYTQQNNNWLKATNTKLHTPWISKLRQTVKGFESKIKKNVNKLFDYSFPSKIFDDDGKIKYTSKYNPNRQGLIDITGVSPIVAILRSLVTSVGITSLAFARDFVFGDATAEATAPFRTMFLSAVDALGDVLTSGIQSFLNLDSFDGTTTTNVEMFTPGRNILH